MICIYSFGTIIPWTDFIQKTVPRTSLFKKYKNIDFVCGNVNYCNIGTNGTNELIFYGAASRIMLVMGRKGQLPKSFAVIDEKCTPKMANTVLAILTLIGPFLGKKMLVSLTAVSALGFIFACTVVSFACLKMRFTEPDLHRPYKVLVENLALEWLVSGVIIVGLMVVPISPVQFVSL